MKLNISQGLQNVAGTVSGMAGVTHAAELQKQELRRSASQFQFQGLATDLSVDLSSFINQKERDFEQSWSKPGFDRENAVATILEEIQSYYDSAIATKFTEAQQAQFEAQFYNELLGGSRLKLEELASVNEFNEGKTSYANVIAKAPEMVTLGESYSSALVRSQNAIEELHTAGYYQTETDYTEAKTTLVTSLNRASMERQIFDMVNGGDLTAEQIHDLVLAVNKGDAALAGKYQTQAQEMIDRLERRDGLDLFTYDDVSTMESRAVAIAQGNAAAESQAQSDVAEEMALQVARMDGDGTLTVSGLYTALGRVDNPYKQAIVDAYLPGLKAEADNRLVNAMSAKINQVKAGTLSVEDFENDSAWLKFYTKSYGEQAKLELVEMAKNTYDANTILELTKKYGEMDASTAFARTTQQKSTDVELLEDEKAAMRGRGDGPATQFEGVWDPDDLAILDSLYDQNLALQLRADIDAGFAPMITSILESEVAAVQRSNYFALEQELQKNGSSVYKQRLVNQAFVNQDIDSTQKSLLNTLTKFSNSSMFSDITKLFDDYGKAAVMTNPDQKSLTADQSAEASLIALNARRQFETILSQNADQVTDDFMLQVAKSITSVDALVRELLDTTYGNAEAKNWYPGGEDFGKFTYVMHNEMTIGGPEMMPVAADHAQAGALAGLQKEFGPDVQFMSVQDDQGPMFAVTAGEVPKLVEAFENQFRLDYGDQEIPDVTGHKFWLHYTPVEGSKKYETELSGGIVVTDEFGHQFSYTFPYYPEKESELNPIPEQYAGKTPEELKEIYRPLVKGSRTLHL